MEGVSSVGCIVRPIERNCCSAQIRTCAGSTWAESVCFAPVDSSWMHDLADCPENGAMVVEVGHRLA